MREVPGHTLELKTIVRASMAFAEGGRRSSSA